MHVLERALERERRARRALEHVDLRAGCASGTECSLCLERPINAVLLPCGHACACVQCVTRLASDESAVCPMCRTPVVLATRIFLPAADGEGDRAAPRKHRADLSATWS